VDPIELRAFPRHDDTFKRAVIEVIDGLQRDDPAALEQALRARYPGVRVTPQSSLATLGATTVWYVFRDGIASGEPSAAGS
jgi:hypothetical protein